MNINVHNWFGEIGDYIITCPTCGREFWSFKHDRFRYRSFKDTELCFERTCPVCKTNMIVPLSDCKNCTKRVDCLILPVAVSREKIPPRAAIDGQKSNH